MFSIGEIGKKRSVPIFWLAVCGLFLAVGTGTSAWAAEELKKDERIVHKEMTGQVVWVGKRAISVEYGQTANESLEMLLPFDSKTLKLGRIKSLSELKRGDTVRVQYSQTLKRTGEDDAESVANTVATTVALVRQAPADAPTQSSELMSGP